MTGFLLVQKNKTMELPLTELSSFGGRMGSAVSGMLSLKYVRHTGCMNLEFRREVQAGDKLAVVNI